MDIKEFLGRDDIQELLAEENLDKIYDLYPSHSTELTEFLVENDIEPLNYMSRIVTEMYYNSGITQINIPHNITSIDSGAFRGCRVLTISCIENSYTEQYAKKHNIPVNLTK